MPDRDEPLTGEGIKGVVRRMDARFGCAQGSGFGGGEIEGSRGHLGIPAVSCAA